MNRYVARLLVGLSLASALTVAPPDGRAAGGAHIVDDSEVEVPGTCHVELWVTRFVPGDGYGNVAPACTFEKIPWLEIGASYQHYWDQTINAPLFGPQIKFNLRPEDSGVGFGLEFTTGVNLATGNLNLASVTGLMSIPIGSKLDLNLNAGWSYLSGDTPNALFWGAQVEVDVGWDIVLMLEAFGRQPGQVGNQMGLRYTPNGGRFDIDLLAGTIYDNSSTKFFTMGVTIRF